jgi:4-hydroxybenzoate polyprenyltransferase
LYAEKWTLKQVQGDESCRIDMSQPDSVTPDSEYRGLIGLLPQSWRNLALLARLDRPTGWWLLYWPCLFGLGLAGGLASRWDLALWFLLGAIAMRGAGCVYNDILDRDLDAQVARTASRPLASGQVSLKAAWVWLLALCLIGLVVLWQLNFNAQLLALESLLLVAAYPLMKRITWWPQLWLGLVFSWGALVGWIAVAEHAAPAMFWLYAGTVFWVIGYDTIYAMQDREDDALVGIRSSALRLGGNIRLGVALFYALTLLGWGMAIWSIRPQGQALVALAPAALHLIWQPIRLRQDGSNALLLFRANRVTGMLATLAFFIVGASA